ncbi:unnamed protein product [Arabidopsis lyrata]|nr:unnamed protein product [Arabidopsis lyrata]
MLMASNLWSSRREDPHDSCEFAEDVLLLQGSVQVYSQES